MKNSLNKYMSSGKSGMECFIKNNIAHEMENAINSEHTDNQHSFNPHEELRLKINEKSSEKDALARLKLTTGNYNKLNNYKRYHIG